MSDDDKTKAIFLSIGLKEGAVDGLLKNSALSAALLKAIEDANVKDGCDASIGTLLYTLTTKLNDKATPENMKFLAEYIGNEKIDKVRIGTAIKLVTAAKDKPIDVKAFEEKCGVGIVVTDKQIEEAVAAEMEKHQKGLLAERYHYNSARMIGTVGAKLKWADGGVLHRVIEEQVAALLGPKTEADLKPKPKVKKSKDNNKGGGGPKKMKGGQIAAGKDDAAKDDNAWFFPSPTANLSGNRPHILAKHLEETGGKVITRFPPEPNGYLHVGHAKAMHLDFGYGSKLGECILRFDDTNPAAEKQEYIDSIIATVAWLGHKPSRITYSSDYFQKLYELAVELIQRGLAYVCHQTGEEAAEYRQQKKDSPYRNRSVEENLRLFEEMRTGLFDEGAAWLRMKIDMQSDNTAMRDPCAYRVKYMAHPRSGDAWCIYPSYDFTHCIVDSLENITHSLCTLEFDVRRAAYYWLLDALDLYKPLVWEFSRLEFVDRVEIDGAEYKLITDLSKRRLLAKVNRGEARGWDDPRMPTLDGCRRRGIIPEAIERLCEDVGVTRGIQRIPVQRLFQVLRAELDPKATRRMAVLRPLRVVITNFDEQGFKLATLPNHPLDESRGTRTLPFTNVVYVEQSDFRMDDDPDFYGLAPGKTVGLRYAGNITVDKVDKDVNGAPTTLHATLDTSRTQKTKGHIHWLPDPEQTDASRRATVRIYEWMFHIVRKVEGDQDEAAEAAALRAKAEAAAAADDEQTDADNEEAAAPQADDTLPKPLTSEEELTGCLVESNTEFVPFLYYQFERLGYFVVDPDSTDALPVLNRTCTLKDSYSKKKGKSGKKGGNKKK